MEARFPVLLCVAVLAFAGVSCVKNVRKERRIASGTLANPPSAQNAGAPLSYRSLPVQGPFIAMTFDDGPAAQNTPRLLDMLTARGIKATFFTVGQNAQRYPQIIRRIVADGHELANHTWTHPWLSKMRDEAVRSELQRSRDALVSISGAEPRMYRPPYGAITARQKEWIMNEFGYPTIFWSVDCGDSRTKNPAAIRSRILTDTCPGAIILVHDLHSWSVDAMPGTLDGLMAKGFRFVTMSQLMAMSSGRKQDGEREMASSSPRFSPGSF
ncbi:MAG TPA: polysaccharide deacetylase family protein [Verrucomicrobiales bacterium]|nr:polysaccharide deacetylase family protein [Verrucomicrobiales bacterium]